MHYYFFHKQETYLRHCLKYIYIYIIIIQQKTFVQHVRGSCFSFVHWLTVLVCDRLIHIALSLSALFHLCLKAGRVLELTDFTSGGPCLQVLH